MRDALHRSDNGSIYSGDFNLTIVLRRLNIAFNEKYLKMVKKQDVDKVRYNFIYY